MEELKYATVLFNSLAGETKGVFTLWLFFHYTLPAITIFGTILVLVFVVKKWATRYYLTEEFHEKLSKALGRTSKGILNDYEQQLILEAIKKGTKK